VRVTAYRIFKTKLSSNWYTGNGAGLYGGRWNFQGTRVLYASATLSLAALEVLVGLNSESLLSSFSFATVQFDNKLLMHIDELQHLPENWRGYPPPAELQQIGTDWVISERSLVLQIPSVVIPAESNYMINVLHRDFSKIDLGEPKVFDFDERLR
jgi:RES domain-containing protein